MNFVRLCSLLLVAAILNSCAYYSPFLAQKDPPPSFQGRVLKLIWDSQAKHDLYMSEVTIKDAVLTGKLKTIENFPKKNNKQLINVYLDPTVPQPDSLSGIYSLPLSGITKIEVYDLDLGGSIVSTFFVLAGVGLLLSGITLLLIVLFKESCPFVYVYNGHDFELSGEIYSGAIFPSLERDDFMALPHIQPLDNEYQIRIANQVQEIQYTNLAELCVVDHPQDTEILVDKHGYYHTVSDPQKPLAAHSTEMPDLLPLITAKDSIKYLGDETAKRTQSHDVLYIDFAKPAKTDTAKLILRAKNSFWLDYTLGQFFNLFGNRYNKWYDKQNSSPSALEPNWPLQQGIPLSVYMKQNGEWKYIDYFEVIGPMADRDVIMQLELPALKDADKIELRLECGAMFWEIDYVGMDFSPQQKIFRNTVALNKAVDEKGRNVTNQMTRDDKKYYTMPDVGNQALLTYSIPPSREGMDRTVFLHSKGHYKIIANPRGIPDVKYLESFWEPGRFGLFSREIFQEMKESLAQ